MKGVRACKKLSVAYVRSFVRSLFFIEEGKGGRESEVSRSNDRSFHRSFDRSLVRGQEEC